MGTNLSDFDGSAGKEPASGEDQNKRPVEKVSWYDAITFCNKLSLLDGKEPVYSVSGISDWAGLAYGAIPTDSNAAWTAAVMDTGKSGYRLPTEMEWVWAAIGADTANPGQLNTTGYSKAFAGSNGTNSIGDYAWYSSNSGGKTHEVSKKAANELELYDMTGNLNEWCWDGDGSYPSGTLTDYQGVSNIAKMIRGSCWGYNAADSTIARRVTFHAWSRESNIGFRVVCGQ
jgi:formylglycine-generating enzyme required for sulfatase activity